VRYLETGSQNPYYNLAFEEYVLANRRDGDYLLLWQNDNTIVVGQNQNAEAEINRPFVDAHGIRVGMEHLNTSETNNLNTVAETYAFVQKAAEGLPAGAPVPGITMDTYHVTRENEPLAVILPLFGAVYHCHTAHPDGRGPVTAEDLPYLCAVMGGLMAAGYAGRFSLECGMADFETEAAAALSVLRAAAAVCEL
jgi:sugar phosphate isomerase/epimerase